MKSFYETTVFDVAALYENYTCIHIKVSICLSIWRRYGRPDASTAVPVLTLPSLHCIKVANVAPNDAEDINVKHSNFKTILRDNTKTKFCTTVAIHYPVTTCPLREILLDIATRTIFKICSLNSTTF